MKTHHYNGHLHINPDQPVPLDFQYPMIVIHSISNRPKLSISTFTQSNRVFLRFPQSLSSYIALSSLTSSTCSLLLLTYKLTGSSLKNWLTSIFFLLSFKVKPQTHLSVLISFLSNFASSIFIGKVSQC